MNCLIYTDTATAGETKQYQYGPQGEPPWEMQVVKDGGFDNLIVYPDNTLTEWASQDPNMVGTRVQKIGRYQGVVPNNDGYYVVQLPVQYMASGSERTENNYKYLTGDNVSPRKATNYTMQCDRDELVVFSVTGVIPSYDVKVTKHVESEKSEDLEKEFTFNAEYYALGLDPSTGAQISEKKNLEFKLKDGEYRVLPVMKGTKFTVTETALDGFSTTYAVDAAETKTAGLTATIENVGETSHTVDFYNKREDTPPPPPETVKLTVTKRIEGGGVGDFAFTVTVDGNEPVEFTLSPNGAEPVSYKIDEIEKGSTVVIQEGEHPGYYVSGSCGEDTFTGDTYTVEDIQEDTTVNFVNTPGSELPETGGVGVGTVYALGALLIVSALVCFGVAVSRKKFN